MPNKEYVTSRVPEKLKRELWRMAKERDWTLSKVVFRALEAYVKREANA